MKLKCHPIILWVWHVPSAAFLPLCLPVGQSTQWDVEEDGQGGGPGNEEGCGTVGAVQSPGWHLRKE